jgi:uncharacterized membrane protein YqaE (UPF0057 family)
MRYLIALLLPPLGLLLCAKIFQAIFCLLLMITGIGWPLASIWAMLVVHNYYADQRNEKLLRELRRSQ